MVFPSADSRFDYSVDCAFDFFGAEYAALFSSANATAFQHPQWLGALARDVAPGRGAKNLTITGRLSGTGELVFVLPLTRRMIRGVAMVECADFGVTDYSAPVVHTRYRKHLVTDSRLARTILALAGHCDIFRVKAIRDEHGSMWAAIAGTDLQPADFSAHSVALGSPYAQWRTQAFGKSHARYLDRKRKRFEKLEGVRFEVIGDSQSAHDAIFELASLRAGRFDNDPIQDPLICRFYANVARDGEKSGYTRTYRLSENDNTVGIVFGTVHDGTYNYLLIGCDYDGFSRHSPGLLMYDYIMADWLAAGGSVFDFTIGDEPFKAKFGTTPTAIATITRATSMQGRLALTAKGIGRRLRTMRATIKTPPPLAPVAASAAPEIERSQND